jgi:hypothetical protein
VQLFTIMVMMALLTTFMTSPMVGFVYPPKYRKYEQRQQVQRTATFAPEEAPHGFSALVVVQRMDDVPGIALLMQLLGTESLSAVSGRTPPEWHNWHN